MWRRGAESGVAKLASLTFACLLLLSLAGSLALVRSTSPKMALLSVDAPAQEDGSVVQKEFRSEEYVAGELIVKFKPELWRSATRSSTWVEVSTSPYIRDYSVGVTGAGENVYIANSTTGGTNYFMRYNTDSSAWDGLSTPPEPFKNSIAMAWDRGNYIYVLLGSSYSISRYLFYRYDVANNTWTRLEDTPRINGAGNAVCFVPGWVLGISDDNFIYAIVGHRTAGSGFYRYSTKDGTWSGALSFPWSNTDDGCSLAWTGGDYLYALRGEYMESSPCYEFSRYDLINDTWASRAQIPAWPYSGGRGGVGDGGSLLWVGGTHSDYIYALSGNQCYLEPIWDNRFYRYTISTNSWERLEDLPAGVGDQNGPRLGFVDENIYCWRGCNGDGTLWAYSVDTIPPAAPELISPENGAITTDNTPTFMWGNVYDPSGVTYDLQVDSNSDFSSPEINVSSLAENTYTVPGEDALSGDTYYWRVRAIDGAGNPGDWSEVWQFTYVIPHDRIIIRGNENFTPANGVTGGSGMVEDPYIIEGWEIDASVPNTGFYGGAIDISETDKPLIIRNNYIHGGRDVSGALSTAIKGSDVWYVTIKNNLVDSAGRTSYGVVIIFDDGPEGPVPFSAFNAIDGNTIQNTRSGIALWGDPTSYIMNNTVRNIDYSGIIVGGGAMNIVVQNNTVDNAGGNYWYGQYRGGGIWVMGAEDILFEHNTITNSRLHGMDFNDYYAVDYDYDIEVRRNTFENSAEYGIKLEDVPSLGNVKIFHNDFINSGYTPQGYSAYPYENAAFDNGYRPPSGYADETSGGNYWSDYAGSDENHGANQDILGADNIGDTTYVLDGGFWDNYPLMVPFEDYLASFDGGRGLGPIKLKELSMEYLPQRYRQILRVRLLGVIKPLTTNSELLWRCYTRPPICVTVEETPPL